MVTALYRRYRPEAFSEMIGQAQVTEPLMTALRTGRIGHAYLFSGPRGCGKTTSARILARCLNCAEGPTDTPCGVCPSCVELSRDGGGSLDVVEIDAASHGGVDDARDLRERAVFAPARDRYKIFIIDEAHMVTAGGFNALLKIVEEPPPHVKFVFATTEPEKVIGTIRSRTHHYPFRLIAPGALIDYVQGLCDSEGIEVEPGVLPLVVRAGGGSARDTLSILDQLIAGSEEGRVTLDRATGLLGFTSTELLDDVVTALGAHDSAAAFRASDRVVQTGQDPRRFVEDLLERLRDLIVIGATSVQGASAVFRGVPDDQLQRMFEQSQIFAPGELSRMADTVSGALDKMAGATAPRLQLELMIARALAAGSAGSAATPRSPQTAAPAGAPRAAAPATVRQPPAPAQTAAPAPAPAPAEPAAPASPAAPAVDPETRPAAAWAEAAATAAAPEAQDRAAAAPRTSSVGGPASEADAPAPNAAEAVRAAREFLRTDSAGAAPFGRPVTDVLAGVPREPLTAEPAPAQASAESVQPRPRPDDAASASASAAAPDPAPAATGASTPAPAGSSAALDDLMEVWPDLLEEILQRDRDAWNAVRSITPMGLDGELLTVGLASESDLAAFKTAGAGPLRETILEALGVNVKYRPKRLAPGQSAGQNGQQGAGREPGDDAAQRETPSSDAEEPHRGASSGTAEPQGGASADVAEPHRDGSSGAPTRPEAVDPLEAKLRARLGSAALAPKPEPVTTAEAVAAVLASEASEPASASEPAQSAQPVPAPEPPRAADPRPAPQPETWQDDEPSDDPDGDPWAEAGGDPYQERALPVQRGASAPPIAPAAESVPASAEAPSVSVAAPRKAPAALPSEGPTQAVSASADPASAVDMPKDEQPRNGGPKFTRYGEAVVREVLGARFIEERPLPVAPGYTQGEGERA